MSLCVIVVADEFVNLCVIVVAEELVSLCVIVVADELVSLRESEEKLKQQQQEATQRENMLVMRLSSKEQEMQDYIVRSAQLSMTFS